LLFSCARVCACVFLDGLNQKADVDDLIHTSEKKITIALIFLYYKQVILPI
jgi:hypothetical protein